MALAFGFLAKIVILRHLCKWTSVFWHDNYLGEDGEVADAVVGDDDVVVNPTKSPKAIGGAAGTTTHKSPRRGRYRGQSRHRPLQGLTITTTLPTPPIALEGLMVGLTTTSSSARTVWSP